MCVHNLNNLLGVHNLINKQMTYIQVITLQVG